MTKWQALLLAVCDPRSQPHPFMDTPTGLADAIAAALRAEALCLCERCPYENWSSNPTYPSACWSCAHEDHEAPPAERDRP